MKKTEETNVQEIDTLIGNLSDKMAGLKKSLTTNNLFSNKDMVFVEGGKYKPSFADEEITVMDLEVCKYQVTQDIYKELMGNNPSNWKEGRRPVEKVTWWEALEFCNKLSEAEGYEPVYVIENNSLMINQLGEESANPNEADFKKTKGYRLPTELEWEWFARGGEEARQNNTFNTKYAGSNNIDEVAWYERNSGSQTHAVGSKNPNELGIYDCSGNVWEWCYDTTDDDEISDDISEERPYIYKESVGFRRLRGGSWNFNAVTCLWAYRIVSGETRRFNINGFRLVRTV